MILMFLGGGCYICLFLNLKTHSSDGQLITDSQWWRGETRRVPELHQCQLLGTCHSHPTNFSTNLFLKIIFVSKNYLLCPHLYTKLFFASLEHTAQHKFYSTKIPSRKDKLIVLKQTVLLNAGLPCSGFWSTTVFTIKLKETFKKD